MPPRTRRNTVLPPFCDLQKDARVLAVISLVLPSATTYSSSPDPGRNHGGVFAAISLVTRRLLPIAICLRCCHARAIWSRLFVASTAALPPYSQLPSNDRPAACARATFRTMATLMHTPT